MREQRARLARAVAGALVFGTLVIGAATPADAAVATTGHQAPRHLVKPSDTGWNGT